MSDFEFITEEEYQKIITDSLINGICVNTNVLKGLRKFLNDKCQRRYTNSDGVDERHLCNGIWAHNEDTYHTHKIHYFLQEIKPEVVECEKYLGIAARIWCDQDMSSQSMCSDTANAIAEILRSKYEDDKCLFHEDVVFDNQGETVDDVDYCFKCGERLKADE